MRLKLIELTNGFNFGKFAVGRFEPHEWGYLSVLDATMGMRIRLIAGRGWSPDHVLILDLQTGEGAMFLPGGMASADLRKKRIWVCPMFEPFLVWAWKQDLTDLDALPALVELTELEAPSSMQGYRRTGVQEPFVEFT